MTETRDTLVEMFGQQLELMKKLGVNVGAQPPHLKRFSMEVINAVLGICSESGEVADELTHGTKPWKSSRFDEVKLSLIEESVDVLFFLMEVWILMGMTPSDIQKLYSEKVDRLYIRIEKGSK